MACGACGKKQPTVFSKRQAENLARRGQPQTVSTEPAMKTPSDEDASETMTETSSAPSSS